MTMSSSRPYIIRALYEWILDNECTPHLLVNAMDDHVEVPQQYVDKGQIVLNISPTAVVDLLLTNEAVQFSGRFGGVPMDVFVPVAAVMGIYARENGKGMVFDLNEEVDPDPELPPTKKTSKPTHINDKKKPGLKVVK